MQSRTKANGLQPRFRAPLHAAARPSEPSPPTFHRVEIVTHAPRRNWLAWLILALALAIQIAMAWKLLGLEEQLVEGAETGRRNLVGLRGLTAQVRELDRRRESAEQERAAALQADLAGVREEMAAVKQAVRKPSVIFQPVPAAPVLPGPFVEAPPAPSRPQDPAGAIVSSLSPATLPQPPLSEPTEPEGRGHQGWAKRGLSGGLLVASAFLPPSTPLVFAQSRPVQRSVKKALGFNSKARNVADDVLDAAEDAEISRENRGLRRKRERRDHFFDGFLKIVVPGFD